MKNNIIIAVIFMLHSFFINAQEYARDMHVHNNGQITTYAIPSNADGFQIVDFVYSSAPDGYENGFPYVDLDLPSGLRWAIYNIGAKQPIEFGNYYAWGAISSPNPPKYDWTTYPYSDSTGVVMTKYCLDSQNGLVDGLVTLTPGDDVATSEWGGRWRMPTSEDFDELSQNCTFIQGFVDDVFGVSLISNNNGATVFAPAAGFYLGEQCATPEALNGEHLGLYWSSSLYEQSDISAYFGGFSTKIITKDVLSRCMGLSVRAVYDPYQATGAENGYGYVDLGLPSGIKWATCNIGANSPTEFGNLYAYGKVEGEDYAEDDPTIYFEDLTGDPVAKIMGEGWRMPTKEDFEEMGQNCQFKRAYLKGVYGLIIIGPNGNYMFAPAAGLTLLGHHLTKEAGLEEEGGYYWSSTIYEGENPVSSAMEVWTGMFSETNILLSNFPSIFGASIRPVYDPESSKE